MPYQALKERVRTLSPTGFSFLEKRKVIIKYLISGGTAASVDLLLLFFFTDFLNLHYVLSASLAFCVAVLVSFTLQKFWTFRDKNEKLGEQLFVYVIVGIVNLLLNAGLMYFLVDKVGLFYILAQIVAGALVAVWSFVIYRFVIFKKVKQTEI